MDIVDRIRQLANQKEVSLTKIERALGFGNGTIGKWIKQSPSCEKIKLVADYLNTSTDYLIYGGSISVNPLDKDEKELLNYYKELDERDKGSILGKAEGLAEAARRQKALAAAPIKKAKPKAVKMPEPEPTDEPEDENETEYEEEYFEIPLAELPASAGTGIYLDSGQTETIKVAANEKTRQTDFAVKVSGDSMEPRYYSGDIVLVRDEPVRIGEIGIFVYEGEGYIKKLGDGCLISLNPKYPNIQIENPDSLFCQGRVISVLRLVKKRR